jgi:hypothetical protein
MRSRAERKQRRADVRLVRRATEGGAGGIPLLKLWQDWPFEGDNPYANKIAEVKEAQKRLEEAR